MYIKFLKHGKGDPAKASSYLIDEVDHLNRPRPDIQVLRGDPQTFTAIAQSITNEWIYTSGVIAWSKSDNPTNEEINEVLDTFENHAFSGLQPNQYHFTAVLHEEDDGSKHVHFLVPRIELETKKALNIAPPGHEKYYDPLRDYFNYEKGWSRPDDPTLQRDTQTPDYVHFQDKFAVRAGLKNKSVNDIREIVGDYIEQRVEHGFIRNRMDVLDAVSELGIVTRTSEKFISLKLDGAERAIRLKGAFYESEFSIESYFENRTRKTNDARASSEYRVIPTEHRELAQQLRAEFTELGRKRSTYNRERYQVVIGSQAEPSFNPNREPEFSPISTTANERNSRSFEPTSTAAQSVKSAISSVEQSEPEYSRISKNKENSFYLQYGFSFDISYFAYIEHQSWLRQQEQIQRHKRDAEQSRLSEIRRGEPESSEVRNREGLALVRSNRPDSRELQEQLRNSAGNKLNESRSAIIENYRRRSESIEATTASIEATTASIEATTARTRESTATHSTAISDYRAVKELHEYFKREAQRGSEDRREISADNTETIRANYFRKFFTDCSRELESTARKTFERFSAELTGRWPSQKFDSEHPDEVGTSRNRAAIEATDRASDRENQFSRAISTKSRRFNPTSIFAALDQLDQRRELQREQERKNDRGYDSPSPF